MTNSPLRSRQTRDGLTISVTPEHGYYTLCVTHPEVAGGLAYVSLDACIAGTDDERALRRRILSESRQMLAESTSEGISVEFAVCALCGHWHAVAEWGFEQPQDGPSEYAVCQACIDADAMGSGAPHA